MNKVILMIRYFIIINVFAYFVPQTVAGYELEFEVITTDITDAGTASNIYFYVHGSKNSIQFSLDMYLSRGSKLKNKYDVGDLGELNYVVFYIDGKADLYNGRWWHVSYITVSKNGDNVCEGRLKRWMSRFESVSMDCTKKIHSVSKPSKLSSVFDSDQQAKYANDGNVQRKYSYVGYCPITKSENSPWFSVDLLETVIIAEIGIENINVEKYILNDFSIYAKSTGDFEKCADFYNGKADTHFYVTCQTVGRHVKLIKTGELQIFSLCQFEVFGLYKSRSELELTSPGKIVTTSGETGVNGNDGNTNTEVELNSRPSNYFRIDLGTALNVYYIHLWFKYEDNDRLKGALLLGYNDENNKYACAELPSTYGRDLIRVHCSIKVRFIELLNYKETKMHFSELEIYSNYIDLDLVKKTVEENRKSEAEIASASEIIYGGKPIIIYKKKTHSSSAAHLDFADNNITAAFIATCVIILRNSINL